jgi:acetyl esterase/lipase
MICAFLCRFLKKTGKTLYFCPAPSAGVRHRRVISQGRWRAILVVLLFAALLPACTPTPEANVIGYLIAERTGRLTARAPGPGGTLAGIVRGQGKPLAGATVLVAERNGRTHVAQSDARGAYVIADIPPGHYVPAAVAPGFEEMTLQTPLGNPQLVTIVSGEQTMVAPFDLIPYRPAPLPTPLAPAVALTVTARYHATTTFPISATATVSAYRFTYAELAVDTLRLYLPMAADAPAQLPLLYMVYPTAVDLWQSISIAYAVQGYAVLAISPMAARALDIDAHATDARVGLTLAQQGALSARIRPGPAVALGGSFSSAVLHRLLRTNLPDTAVAEARPISGWVTVGGITNAFSGTAAFYQGTITIPPEYQYLIPALGAPNLYPLAFLRYSPVYTAAQLPPTLIIHTDVDRIIPIEQAYELEAALRAAGVPTEVYYYEDVSHYLQIDDQMTDAGREMFYRVLDFANRILEP